MFAKLNVAQKLAVTVALFAVPVMFVVWTLIGQQRIAIAFADQEVAGANYLTALSTSQGLAARMTLSAAEPDQLADQLAELDRRYGASLDTATVVRGAIAALRKPDGLEDGRTKLRDIITRIGDRSNLILDNVLVTYYLTDVGLNRLPDALDRIADLSREQAFSRETGDAKAHFLVGLGSLVAAIEGADASFTSAVQAPGGAAVKAALGQEQQTVHAALTGFVAELREGPVDTRKVLTLLGDVSHFSQHADAVLTDLLTQRVANLYSSQRITLGITAGMFLLAIGAVLLAVRRSITQPLSQLQAITLELAAGRLDITLPPIRSTDEIGAVFASLAVFQRQGLERRAMDAAAAAERTRKEQAQAVMAEHTLNFSQSIAGVMGTLGQSATTMRTVSNGLIGAVADTHQAAERTMLGAEQSSQELAGVAAATEELTASIDEIARQVVQTAQTAQNAVAKADAAGVTVQTLSDAAGQISAVVQLIADIAGKTNLLALNATIEAARAGDAGKGFAVVASEVKALAAQTARATSEISGQVAAIQATTVNAASAVGGVRDAIGALGTITTAISAAVEEQGTATREIAANVNLVAQQNAAITEAMKNVGTVAAGASASSETVRSTAEALEQISTALNGQVDTFLAKVRRDAA